MPRWTAAPLAIALMLELSACGDATPDPNNPLAQLTAAANEVQKAAEGLTSNRKPVAPVAFRDLMAFLPARLADMERAEPKGRTTTAGSWQYSQAEMDFRSKDGKRHADVGIFDYAHIPFLYVPFTMILNMNVATESTEGYEKSAKVAGYPAFERWNRNGNSEIVVLVGDRFIVKSDTRGLGEGWARKIVERLDLKRLAAKGK
ncbi:hypothetical protein BH24GEM1_BH24GEM1_21140 [soil metagenome]